MNALVRDLFVTFLLTASATAKAATITAASVARNDVLNALNQAGAGDTVLIPAGSAGWTSGIDWDAPPNVTVKGAGTSATGGGNQTVITDNVGSNSQLLDISIADSGVFRLTGITFRSGSGALKDGGTISFGPGKVRIDHCHFFASSRANYKMIPSVAGVFGVMDHCILDFTDT